MHFKNTISCLCRDIFKSPLRKLSESGSLLKITTGPHLCNIYWPYLSSESEKALYIGFFNHTTALTSYVRVHVWLNKANSDADNRFCFWRFDLAFDFGEVPVRTHFSLPVVLGVEELRVSHTVRIWFFQCSLHNLAFNVAFKSSVFLKLMDIKSPFYCLATNWAFLPHSKVISILPAWCCSVGNWRFLHLESKSSWWVCTLFFSVALRWPEDLCSVYFLCCRMTA